MDAEAFASLFTADGSFRFGNAEPEVGRERVQRAVAGFFSSIVALRHHDLQTWNVQEDIAVTEGRVQYTRQDGSTVDLPFVNVYRTQGPLIEDYRIYVDVGPLFAG
jgi:hypothetical protein